MQCSCITKYQELLIKEFCKIVSDLLLSLNRKVQVVQKNWKRDEHVAQHSYNSFSKMKKMKRQN